MMKQMKQFIATITIYISVELKVMLQAYIKNLSYFLANDVGILIIYLNLSSEYSIPTTNVFTHHVAWLQPFYRSYI